MKVFFQRIFGESGKFKLGQSRCISTKHCPQRYMTVVLSKSPLRLGIVALQFMHATIVVAYANCFQD